MTDNQQAESVIDIDVALSYTAGDREMLVSIAELFLLEGPRQLRAVQASVEQGDPKKTCSAAHKLKGSIVIFGANAAATAVAQVELAAKANDAAQTNFAYEALDREIKRLFNAIEELCRD